MGRPRSGRLLAPNGPGSLGGRADFLGNLLGLVGIEIHRDLGAFRFDIDADHADVGGADLEVCFDVAFGVDAHGRSPVPAAFRTPIGVVRQAREGQSRRMSDVVLRDLRIGDAGWLIEQHGVLYARDEGFDETFEALVAEILADFIRNRDPGCERGWIAERDGQRLGSIFCVRQDAETAKLRMFLLLPEARGLGLGRQLLGTCMEYARSNGYRRMMLWTHESHKAACALYRATGWKLTGSKEVVSFGVPLVEQSWEIAL